MVMGLCAVTDDAIKKPNINMNDFLYKFFLLNIQLFYDLAAKIEPNAGITELIMLKLEIAIINGK